ARCRCGDPGGDQGDPCRDGGGRLAGGPLAPSRRPPPAPPGPPPPPPPPPQTRGRGHAPLPQLDLEAAVTLRFADLNPLGRAIILVVAALTLAVAAIAFATSYGALDTWTRD